jgi:hypothetical protein
MKINFNKLALLAICLCALPNVFGQTNAGSFKEFGEMKSRAESLREGKAYRTTTTTDIYADDLKTVKTKIVSTFECDASGNFHQRHTSESGGVIEKYESIGIGDKSYVKENDAKWRVPEPVKLSESLYGLGNTTGGKFIEKTTFNGQTVNIYEEKNNLYEGETRRSETIRYWFAENGELLKTETRETNLKTGETRSIVEIYEYDPKIKIKAPVMSKKS